MQNQFLGASAVPFNPQTQSFAPATPVKASPTVAAVQQNRTVAQAGVPTAEQNLQAYLKQNPIIPATNLKAEKPVIPTYNPPQPTMPTVNYAQTGMQTIATPVTDQAQNISKLMLDILPNLQGQSQELTNQERTLGVDQMRTNLQNINNQILQKQAEIQQMDVSLASGIQDIEDKTIPMQFITGQQLSLEKRANLAKAVKTSQVNMLNATALAAQGNIALAQDQAQKAVEAKFAPFKEVYNLLQEQLKAIQPLLSAEEKKVAAQQSIIAETQKQLLTIKADQQKNISKMLMQAQANGIDSNTWTRAMNAFNNGADDVEIAGIVGPFGGDQYLANKEVLDFSRNTKYNAVGQVNVDNGYTLEAFKKGVAAVESNGNYKAIGPATRSGDRAYGKYQVMGANIPSWTQEAGLGKMTPEQFLASPDAQEKVFEFQSMKNYAKYGNWDDVASVWFSGRPLTNNTSSDGYNTVPQYVAKVRKNMGIPAQPTTFSKVTDPNLDGYYYEYKRTGKIENVPNGFRHLILARANSEKTNNPQVQALTEKLNLINEALNSNAISSVVGPTAATRGGTLSGLIGKTIAGGTIGVGAGLVTGPGAILSGLTGAGLGLATGLGQSIPFATGEAQNLLGTVEQLTNKQFIEEIIDLKKEAGGIGSLTEEEGRKLTGAASKLSNWAVRDGSGKVIGYAIDEGNFIKELNTIKELSQKGIALAGGNILGTDPTTAYYQQMTSQLNTAGSTQSYGGYNLNK